LVLVVGSFNELAGLEAGKLVERPDGQPVDTAA